MASGKKDCVKPLCIIYEYIFEGIKGKTCIFVFHNNPPS